VGALSVLCGKDLPRRFVADAPLLTPSRASPSAHGARTKRGGSRADLDTESVALDDVLMSVIRTVKDDVKMMNLSSTTESSELEEDERERRRSLRVEAMEALAVVCFILDDARIASDACKFIAECYLEQRQRRKSEHAREEVDALWQSYDSHPEADDTDEGSDDSDSESESDEDVSQENDENENDDGESDEEEHYEESSEPSEDEEDEESEEVEEDEEGQQPRRRTPTTPAIDATEQAQALRVWSFLLSLLTDDQTVLALVGPHKRSLVELILVEGDDARHNVTGTCTHMRCVQAFATHHSK
jgi:chemotaxis protein histidine kinase CheA